jgi:hypothetical protein
MPSIVHEHELDEPDRSIPMTTTLASKNSSRSRRPTGTEEVYSPDEACDLILDIVEQQFWEWYDDPAWSRRFKPRVKVYEVS